MINKLKTKNYQSHQDTELNFDPGVNIIIGSSNEGKSVIMRVFEWIINNRPLGASFVSYWNKDGKENIKNSTYGEIEIDNNIIRRERTKIKQAGKTKSIISPPGSLSNSFISLLIIDNIAIISKFPFRLILPL